jgi:hypothetical protein
LTSSWLRRIWMASLSRTPSHNKNLAKEGPMLSKKGLRRPANRDSGV